MPDLDIDLALGDQPVERHETITVRFRGETYSKITDKWFLWNEDCLEPEYQLEPELEEFLEENEL